MDADSIETTPARGGWRLAVGLFFLSPLVAEFLLGNLPITVLWLLLVLAPLYGGGALLVREVARRFRLGWSGILLLALAYAIVEEAFTTQSLFNPNYLGLRLLDYGYVPALGMSLWWTVFVLGIHVIWSIATPIALMEALSGRRRRQPWLGKLGLSATTVLFLLGCFATTKQQLETDAFRASIRQIVGSVMVIVLLIGLALAQRGRTNVAATNRAAPSTGVTFAVGLGLSSAFMINTTLHGVLPAWLVALILMALFATGCVLLQRWTRADGWTSTTELAFAGGVLLTYAWWGFVQSPSVGDVSALADLIGNAVFSAAAVLFLAYCWRNAKRATTST